MAETTTTLQGISEIRGFFRTNRTPVYFISPTAFNLLGIDRWVRSFFSSSASRRKPIRSLSSQRAVASWLLGTVSK